MPRSGQISQRIDGSTEESEGTDTMQSLRAFHRHENLKLREPRLSNEKRIQKRSILSQCGNVWAISGHLLATLGHLRAFWPPKRSEFSTEGQAYHSYQRGQDRRNLPLVRPGELLGAILCMMEDLSGVSRKPVPFLVQLWSQFWPHNVPRNSPCK